MVDVIVLSWVCMDMVVSINPNFYDYKIKKNQIIVIVDESSNHDLVNVNEVVMKVEKVNLANYDIIAWENRDFLVVGIVIYVKMS